MTRSEPQSLRPKTSLRQAISIMLLMTLALLLGLLFLQNRTTTVELVILGRAPWELSLAQGLGLAYGVGLGIGALAIAGWRWGDYRQQRQTTRQLGRLLDQLLVLEARLPAQDYLPRQAVVPEVEPIDDWQPLD